MPGDPKECREKARHCAALAANAPTPTIERLFSDLATKWEALADALESAERAVMTWNVPPSDK